MNGKHLIYRDHGKPREKLELAGFSTPVPADNQVLLAIHASPVNPADLNLIEGTYGSQPPLPDVPGIECFATVVESRSEKFSAGDAVVPLGKIGGWATHALADAENLIAVPAGIDPLQAAMLKVNPATAWLLLRHFTELHEGDWIVLNAANSNVARCVIQLAREMGVRSACFLRQTALDTELTALGASHVFSDDDAGLAAARDILRGEQARLAFNAVGGESALRLLKLLGDGATHITYGAMGRKALTIPNSPLIFRDITVRGLWVTRWLKNTPPQEIHATYQALAGRVAAESLVQKIDSCHPLESFQQALSRNDSSEKNGKVLFVPSHS